MKKFAVSCLLIGIVSCSVSPKKLDELNSENNYYSPAQTIKCMQMQTPQRPHPINKKGEVRESYDQGDCYDDLLTKNTRELTIEFGKSSIDLNVDKEQEILSVNDNSIDDIDIEAIETKVLKKPKQN
ncbi:hypothetical protein OAS93_01290 [Gammaproteobacteria bacterium]|jgi:hypothetical protein|nr:hypothetical protein [Gammaproteobacteria bacterium]MDB3951599.1 hypothetical protein [Gammaproteobacteria bacterium]MDC1099911.1 hypothetical protein [Gammaproteobacteria bacterium]MDC1171212.1 hypothetical protein [Gammaproteobacteria bacterium]